jgi:DNA-binding transcriptional LysR family regulator
MNINDLDLNLLRLFDMVYRLRSVSRAAEALNLSQPAASQGITRLRLKLKDALFVRAPGGVRPTPRADRLALIVQAAMASIEEALNEGERFDPTRSQMTLRLHLSDIGEARFLPDLMASLHEEAAKVKVLSFPLPHGEIAGALDSGVIEFAIGFLPSTRGTSKTELLRDRYAVLIRAEHPLIAGRRGRTFSATELERLEYVAVRSHSETLRILEQLGLQDRLRLTSSHFLALPAIVRRTDLAVVMPLDIARGFAAGGGYAVVETRLPDSEFIVSLHWSKRFESDPAHRWMHALLLRLFKEARR